jgi:hypothetical protein
VKALEKKYRTMLGVNIVSLGVIARDCNVVMDGRAGQKELSWVVLNENMSKDTNACCSEWSVVTLESVDDFSTRQQLYAAFDAIKPLEIYDKLDAMPNLSGMDVDVFPSTGSIAVVLVNAVGVIKSITPGHNWIVPDRINANQNQRKISAKEQTVIVTLNKVFAKGLKVPHFTRGTEKRALTLGALAFHERPFVVLLSARNLSQHMPERSKLSRPIAFGARAADHLSHVTNIVVDKAYPKEVFLKSVVPQRKPS